MVAQAQGSLLDQADASYQLVWCRSSGTPAAPIGATRTAPGAPWSATQPAANGSPLWGCGARFDSQDVRVTAWQDPQKMEGQDGGQGVRAKRYHGMVQAAAGAEATADLAAEASAAAEGLPVVAGDFYLFTTSVTSGLGAAKIRALGGSWADVPNPTSEQRTLALGDIVDRATFLDGGAVLAVKDVSIVRTLLAKLILAQDVSVFGKLIAASGLVGPLGFSCIWNGDYSFDGTATMADIISWLSTAVGAGSSEQFAVVGYVIQNGVRTNLTRGNWTPAGALSLAGFYGANGQIINAVGTGWGAGSATTLSSLNISELHLFSFSASARLYDSIIPEPTDKLDLGTSLLRFRNAYAQWFIADSMYADNIQSARFEGPLIGNANTATEATDSLNLGGVDAASYLLLSNWAAKTTTNGGTKSANFTVPAMAPGAVYMFTTGSTGITVTLPSGSFFLVNGSYYTGGQTFSASVAGTRYVWRIR